MVSVNAVREGKASSSHSWRHNSGKCIVCCKLSSGLDHEMWPNYAWSSRNFSFANSNQRDICKIPNRTFLDFSIWNTNRGEFQTLEKKFARLYDVCWVAEGGWCLVLRTLVLFQTFPLRKWNGLCHYSSHSRQENLWHCNRRNKAVSWNTSVIISLFSYTIPRLNWSLKYFSFYYH